MRVPTRSLCCKKTTTKKQSIDSSSSLAIAIIRPLGKNDKLKITFLISQPKHMLWVLKRTVSMRRFFRAPKTNAKTDG